MTGPEPREWLDGALGSVSLLTVGEKTTVSGQCRVPILEICLGRHLFGAALPSRRLCDRRYSVVAERIALPGYQGVAAKVFADQVSHNRTSCKTGVWLFERCHRA